MAVTTRDRIVDEAMRLFADHGYKATTIAQIEAGAGLTPGAGGVYHHFKTKEDVLAAGIERHLGRLNSLRDIRRVLGGLGDLTAELTVTARFILAEFDNEAELLRVLVSEGRNRPELLTSAVDQLVGSTFAGFAGWIAERSATAMSEEEANALSVVGLGGLMSSRLLRNLLGAPLDINDEALVRSWVQMMTAILTKTHHAQPSP